MGSERRDIILDKTPRRAAMVRGAVGIVLRQQSSNIRPVRRPVRGEGVLGAADEKSHEVGTDK
jgi:hypothetical protein